MKVFINFFVFTYFLSLYKTSCHNWDNRYQYVNKCNSNSFFTFLLRWQLCTWDFLVLSIEKEKPVKRTHENVECTGTCTREKKTEASSYSSSYASSHSSHKTALARLNLLWFLRFRSKPHNLQLILLVWYYNIGVGVLYHPVWCEQISIALVRISQFRMRVISHYSQYSMRDEGKFAIIAEVKNPCDDTSSG